MNEQDKHALRCTDTTPTWLRAIDLFKTGRVTKADLAKALGIHTVTAARLIGALRAQKLIYIARWDADRMGRAIIPAYRWGQRKDAPKPRTQVPTAERSRRYRQRKKEAT